MAALSHGDGANLDLVVYPGVHHAFDVGWFQPGRGRSVEDVAHFTQLT
jgi:hypothetical protein